MDNFAIKFDISSYYIIDAKMYPKNMDYSFEVVRYKFKKDFTETTVNHTYDGRIVKWEKDNLFGILKNDGVVLILYKQQGNSIVK